MHSATPIADPAPVAAVSPKPKAPRPKDAMSLRIDAATRDLIHRAADVLGQSRTEFMLTSARERAIGVLLNQTLFRLNASDWAAFTDALDDPPPPNEALKALLASKPPWEQ